MCSWTEGSSVVEPSTNMEPLLMMRRAEHKARDDAVMTGNARRWQPVWGSHTGRMVSERCDCSQQAKQPGRGSHAQQACSQNDLNCRTRERRSRRRLQLMRLKQAEDLLVTLGHYARMYKGDGLYHAVRGKLGHDCRDRGWHHFGPSAVDVQEHLTPLIACSSVREPICEQMQICCLAGWCTLRYCT